MGYHRGMAWYRSRPYRDPRYGDRYGYGRWGRPRPYGGGGGSCLRDACLLETGCCIGEALEDSCLIAGVLMMPRLVSTCVGAVRVGPDGRGGSRDDRAPRRSRRSRRSGPSGRVAAAMIASIRLYQREISGPRPPVCRFTPSCSEYGAQAVGAHGALRGSLLTVRRLLRCRPGGATGADPVPARAVPDVPDHPPS